MECEIKRGDDVFTVELIQGDDNKFAVLAVTRPDKNIDDYIISITPDWEPELR